ncbi:MAG TPA: ABC transporter substrate-binding protein, partial [bacterium]|nr:ABC transporter substrate-binding protein [bacterium]
NVEALNSKFSIEVRPVEWATYLDELTANKLTLFILGWGADYPDPHNFVHPFMHTDGSFSAFQSYSNPAVDALIAEGIATVDPAKRQEIYYQLQAIYYEDVPSVGLYQPLERRYERDWVEGWYYNSVVPNSNTVSYLYSISKG